MSRVNEGSATAGHARVASTPASSRQSSPPGRHQRAQRSPEGWAKPCTLDRSLENTRFAVGQTKKPNADPQRSIGGKSANYTSAPRAGESVKPAATPWERPGFSPVSGYFV